MHDAVGVHAAHCRDEVVDEKACLFFMELVANDNQVEEFLSLTELGHDVDKLSLLENFVDLQNAGVILRFTTATRLLSKLISFMIIALALANLRTLIFLMALIFPVASWTALKTYP